MMKWHVAITTFSGLLLMAACSSAAAPFGGTDDVEYAAKLWQQMQSHNLVGPGAFYSTPYRGASPHGDYLDTIDASLVMGEHRGRLLVQRNYLGSNLGKAMVANDPERYLGAVTVMYQREEGYDKVNHDWFWVKYGPTGEVMKDGDGMALSGRVAKGSREGCIACHVAAAGDDMVFNNDRRE
jgi:hypothetical protein